MAQDLQQDFNGTGTAFTSIFGSAINDGNTDTSATVDFGATAPIDIVVEMTIAGSTGTVDGVVKVFMKWSTDNTNFDEDDQAMYLGSVVPTVSATVYKNLRGPVRARYGQLHVSNESNIQITTSCAASYVEVAGDQA